MDTRSFHPLGRTGTSRLDVARQRAGDLRAIIARSSPGGGPDLWACPRHGRSPGEGGTPSLSVFDDGRRWRCHSCGAHGDALDLLAFVAGVPLVEIIRRLTDEGGGASSLPVAPRPRPAGPPTAAKPVPRPTFDAAGAFTRALAFAERAPSTDEGRIYLERRFGSEGFARLLEARAVGVVPLDDEDPKMQRLLRWGYRIALPIFDAPPPGDVCAPLAAVAMNVRSVRQSPEPRYRRPQGGGKGVSYGSIPDEVAAADGGTLAIVEGAGDYLRVVRERSSLVGGVLAHVSASTARHFAEAVAREVEEVRSLGVGGPRRVVLFPHADEAGEQSAREVAKILGCVLGLEVARCALSRRAKS